MASEARRLRDHPSVIAFLIGSDNAPPNKIAKMYVDTLHAADWPNPIVSAASKRVHKNQIPSPSGIKMSGPYAWVPPNYWYADKVGGAFGFIAETSAGADIPRLPTLHQMLTPRARRALWKNPSVKQYHASPAWSPFSTLKLFDTALAHRYGKPTSLADYVEKSQLANYDVVRAQFEAYNAHMNAKNPSTGVIYWMLNSAWPSLHWHLMNYDLNPVGAYFGAQKANQAVHIQYSYNNRAIMAINHTLKPLHGADARIRVYNLDGKMRYSHNVTGIDLPANRATQLVVIPKLKKLSSTYFVELELTNADGQQISRNVYWLSNKPDQLNWAKSKWYTTPVSRYANLKALQKLPSVNVRVKANTQRDGTDRVTTVTVTAPAKGKDVAFFVHLSIRKRANGKPIVPITWSSNDVSLWPGESMTLTARYKATAHVSPVVQVSGWNVSSHSIPVSLQ
jgi:exo-1,4-beta-D-glucosaminidase